MSYPNIFHYCENCEKETTHFNLPNLFTDLSFECVECENVILLEEGAKVTFIKYEDENE